MVLLMFVTGGHRASMQFILASSSPRRQALLPLLGIPFAVEPVDVDETNHHGEEPAVMVARLSREKAIAASTVRPGGPIIAADTTVAHEGDILGKPRDAADATKMLFQLRGKTHTVYSGVTLLVGHEGRQWTVIAESSVTLRRYSEQEIRTYVASGDPLDKAGSYAIQYDSFSPVAKVKGCFANVVGLPLCHLFCLLRTAGVAPSVAPVEACNRFHHRQCDVYSDILNT